MYDGEVSEAHSGTSPVIKQVRNSLNVPGCIDMVKIGLHISENIAVLQLQRAKAVLPTKNERDHKITKHVHLLSIIRPNLRDVGALSLFMAVCGMCLYTVVTYELQEVTHLEFSSNINVIR